VDICFELLDVLAIDKEQCKYSVGNIFIQSDEISYNEKEQILLVLPGKTS